MPVRILFHIWSDIRIRICINMMLIHTTMQGVAVCCPTCMKEFCSLCLASWHPDLSCTENGALLVARGGGTLLIKLSLKK
jgi:hypothetical protein